MNNTNEISKTSNSGFLAVKSFNLNDMVSQEMEGLNISFERIKIPSGGTTMFEIPGDNPDEPENMKEFSAVILYHHPLYSYYKDKYTGGSNPPDCSSTDGLFGVGVPGGKCWNVLTISSAQEKTAQKHAKTNADFIFSGRVKYSP